MKDHGVGFVCVGEVAMKGWLVLGKVCFSSGRPPFCTEKIIIKLQVNQLLQTRSVRSVSGEVV